MSTKSPLFRPYKEVLYQKFSCYFCIIRPPAALINLNCFRYLRRFHPQSKLSLKDIVKFWPRRSSLIKLSPGQKSTSEKRSFAKYFSKSIGLLAQHMYASNPNFRHLLNSLLKLPAELLLNIADLSLPCAIRQPLIVSVETEPAERYLQASGKNPNPG